MPERPDPPYASEQARQRAMTVRLLIVAAALAGVVIALLAKRLL
jgi:hypothetical protein